MRAQYGFTSTYYQYLYHRHFILTCIVESSSLSENLCTLNHIHFVSQNICDNNMENIVWPIHSGKAWSNIWQLNVNQPLFWFCTLHPRRRSWAERSSGQIRFETKAQQKGKGSAAAVGCFRVLQSTKALKYTLFFFRNNLNYECLLHNGAHSSRWSLYI